MSFTKSHEERVKDKTNAASSVVKTVIGIYAKNFQITHGRKIIGRKALSVVSVPLISGDLKSLIAKRMAEALVYHSFVFSLAHSIITITVSIAIHKVRTREKFVRKFRLSHIASKKIKVIMNASGSKRVATSDSLNHTKISIVKNTRTNVMTAVEERFA